MIDLPAIRLSAQFRHFTDGEGARFNRGLSRGLWPGYEVLSFGGLAAQPARTDIELRRGESDHACLARLAAAHAMEA